ncbi:DPH5 [Candida margitis]|uniref:DPH5 n=1 Tax=Candida margitis TaxID=1775924 RepID=UPI00222795D7|nr:DPH5 [Candida margitis]KAI5967890.1 DPH5 [Candida margitis]
MLVHLGSVKTKKLSREKSYPSDLNGVLEPFPKMLDPIDIDEIITDREEESSNLLFNFYKFDSTHKLICQPYDYLSGLPSNNNNIRRKFIRIFNQLFFGDGLTEIELEGINEVISILHNSSLLIDDIEDNSKYRRGFPSAHVKYGQPLTINCANLMYFKAMKIAGNLLDYSSRKDYGSEITDNYNGRLQDTHKALVSEMINLHNGQGLDIYWRDFLPELPKLPTVEDYLDMVQNKTGGLFRLSVKLLKACSPKPPSEEEFDRIVAIANLAGIIYQVRDDYLNLVDARYSTMKGIAGEDLIEGKLSLPILINLREEKDWANSPVHKILYEFRSSKQRSKQPGLLQDAVTYLHNTDSMHATYRTLELFKNKFHELLDEFGYGDSELYKLIETLCDSDITVRGLETVKKCSRVYLEAYTSILMAANQESLESYYGREIILADRELVESGSDEILRNADVEDVAFLVVGDPFGATTHTDLVLRARELGIKVESIHNASIMNAVGACGLQLYQFGQTISLVFFTDSWKPDSFYDKIMENRKIGLHTLVLLDIKVKEQSIENMARGRLIYEPPRYMDIATAAKQLIEIEETRQEQAYTENTPCVAISRLGAPTQTFKAGTLKELSEYDSGEPLHTMVMLGRQVHDLELEYLYQFVDDKDKFKNDVEQDQQFFKPPPYVPPEEDLSD